MKDADKIQENDFGCFYLNSHQKMQKCPQDIAFPKFLIFLFLSDLCQGQPF